MGRSHPMVWMAWHRIHIGSRMALFTRVTALHNVWLFVFSCCIEMQFVLLGFLLCLFIFLCQCLKGEPKKWTLFPMFALSYKKRFTWNPEENKQRRCRGVMKWLKVENVTYLNTTAVALKQILIWGISKDFERLNLLSNKYWCNLLPWLARGWVNNNSQHTLHILTVEHH